MKTKYQFLAPVSKSILKKKRAGFHERKTSTTAQHRDGSIVTHGKHCTDMRNTYQQILEANTTTSLKELKINRGWHFQWDKKLNESFKSTMFSLPKENVKYWYLKKNLFWIVKQNVSSVTSWKWIMYPSPFMVSDVLVPQQRPDFCMPLFLLEVLLHIYL